MSAAAVEMHAGLQGLQVQQVGKVFSDNGRQVVAVEGVSFDVEPRQV